MAYIHPSLLLRKIIHFDMDAYYASIEIRDNPSLKGKPVVVGGSPNSRGVVSTASYEARKYGIHSAMACSQAARLCPSAIFVRPNFEKYTSVSQQIRKVFQSYTDLVEPLSLDEAYLDVTNNSLGLYAVKIARKIQEDILAQTGLTGSAGVAPNKLLAKIASDMNKPHGLTVILPDQALSFMEPLALRKIHGIGPATEQRLLSKGLKYCRDVWPYSVEQLTTMVGNMAEWLFMRSRGIDERSIETSRERKSLGREETFSVDYLDLEILNQELALIVEGVAGDLQKRGLKGKTITLKVKYGDFTRITRSQTIAAPTSDQGIIGSVAHHLMHNTEAGRRKIRLLGVSIANFE